MVARTQGRPTDPLGLNTIIGAMNVESWQRRVIVELDDLQEKMDRLEAFRDGDVYVAMNSQDKGLIDTQWFAMTEYAGALEYCISQF